MKVKEKGEGIKCLLDGKEIVLELSDKQKEELEIIKDELGILDLMKEIKSCSFGTKYGKPKEPKSKPRPIDKQKTTNKQVRQTKVMRRW